MPKPIDVVPGMVLRGRHTGHVRIVLSSTSFWRAGPGVTQTSSSMPEYAWGEDAHEILVDPRTADPLPNPFAIKPGDRVRQVKEIDGVRIETSFVVNHIDAGSGQISSIYGRAFDPAGFHSVLEPDRLPAGTVTRSRSTGNLYLRTVHGYIVIYRGDEIRQGHVLDNDVRDGRHDVLWMP